MNEPVKHPRISGEILNHLQSLVEMIGREVMDAYVAGQKNKHQAVAEQMMEVAAGERGASLRSMFYAGIKFATTGNNAAELEKSDAGGKT